MSMKEIKLTPDWIFDNFSFLLQLLDDGTLFLQCERGDAKWIKLAARTIGAPFISREIEEDDHIEYTVGFEFNINDLKEDCPTVYNQVTKNVTS